AIAGTSVLSPTSVPCSTQNVLHEPLRAHRSVLRVTQRSAAPLSGTVTLPATPRPVRVARVSGTAAGGRRRAPDTAAAPRAGRPGGGGGTGGESEQARAPADPHAAPRLPTGRRPWRSAPPARRRCPGTLQGLRRTGRRPRHPLRSFRRIPPARARAPLLPAR